MGGDWRRREEERNQRAATRMGRWRREEGGCGYYDPRTGCGMFAKKQALFAGWPGGRGVWAGRKSKDWNELGW